MYFFKCPNCREPLAAEREDIMASVECVHCAYQMHLTPGVVSENLFQPPKAPGQAPAKAPAKAPAQDPVQQDTGSSHRVITLIIVLSIVLGIGYVIDSIQSAPDEDMSRLRMRDPQRMADSIQRAQNEIATRSQRTSMEPIPEAVRDTWVIVAAEETDLELAEQKKRLLASQLTDLPYVAAIVPVDTTDPYARVLVIVYGFDRHSDADDIAGLLFESLSDDLGLTNRSEMTVRMPYY